ncbi:MAG: hypothetical protein QGH85_01010 [Candidatus Pacebacteria bacterium]|jgi:Tfp pilus assembly protein PilN|nr:hypothetical protein [Parcubacteria group bacterium]MDP6249439.1 hypothetical protein [Candidatus Paceibacterota bacterium]MDP7159579.1 hypothetical protein [Candidatus Paceibacterota bacterium]MDP7366298.1 hypothetical protein [Candidatus Paceibacterota bacterium]MDP7466187.1 hypothetical protein [Candidatus Paceibacterota bacterium]|tara:strand:+ start:293 stop:886 length:594 start_codon:yes stop_codon:yes gene_type:complete
MPELKTHTSFIPKKSLTAPRRQAKGSSIGIFFLFTLVVFIGAIALAIGVFLYQQFIIKSIEQKSASLARASIAFEPSIIEEISRLDTRINSAQDILDNHKATSAFFDLLEATTLESISFESLDYITDESGKTRISMKGRAQNFSSVALQSDVFGKNKFILEPIFSELDLNKKGDVVFNFSAFIDSRLISYESAILSQ